MILHTIGDSHASDYVWNFQIEGLQIVSHHLGPMTCASFGVVRPHIDYNPEDWLCFCLGEIDCRDHLGKYENWEIIIERILDNYFEVLRTYNAANIFVFNVVPANRQATAAGDPWPCVGTDEQRKEFVMYMNAGLKIRCKINGFMFFDVHDKYADSEGYFNLEYRDHCIHIANPIFLKEFLNEVINSNPVL